ncbi:cytochrome c oxidase assembly cox16 [Trichoderma arundinaceum]|uniref:Cytochrome c oxidase assembly protein COX16, mitochondrial n=1 Tax=Trichoderma arundinaceum TaxID=490622 RepID=A0A395NUX7_TRIAR|nr:cytochrome c oxidase assembly cox16 [Trichoderma arundinaceum]
MPTFQNKTFRSSADAGKIGMKYRSLIAKHPFLTFGLPFIAVIVAGSFVLTPATAIRYEKHDRKVRQLTKEEELNVRRAARKVDMKEEYYVSLSLPQTPSMQGKYTRRGYARAKANAGRDDAEACWEGSGQLGAEASREAAWGERRHPVTS